MLSPYWSPIPSELFRLWVNQNVPAGFDLMLVKNWLLVLKDKLLSLFPSLTAFFQYLMTAVFSLRTQCIKYIYGTLFFERFKCNVKDAPRVGGFGNRLLFFVFGAGGWKSGLRREKNILSNDQNLGVPCQRYL